MDGAFSHGSSGSGLPLGMVMFWTPPSGRSARRMKMPTCTRHLYKAATAARLAQGILAFAAPESRWRKLRADTARAG
jgi:hypothetical protein